MPYCCMQATNRPHTTYNALDICIPDDIETVITFNTLESHVCKELVNGLIPHTRGLLQSVRCTPQFAHQVLISRCDESLWLLHVDFFFQVPIQKCCLDIHLM